MHVFDQIKFDKLVYFMIIVTMFVVEIHHYPGKIQELTKGMGAPLKKKGTRLWLGGNYKISRFLELSIHPATGVASPIKFRNTCDGN